MVRPFYVQRLPASTGLTMETFWSRRIHVVLERPPSNNDATLYSCAQNTMIRSHKFQSVKRKVGLRESIRHLSHDVHNAATVWPMTADALGRVLSQLPRQVNMMRRRNTTKMLKTHSNHAHRSPD